MITSSKGEKIFNVFNIIFLSIIVLAIIYPFINVVAISFNEGMDTTRDTALLFPRKFTLENYRIVFGFKEIRSAIFISFLRTILGTLIHMFTIILAAYALKKRDLVFRKFFITIFLIPNFINGGIIPTYLNFRNLHLTDNFLVYILPTAFSFFNWVIIRTYMEGLPAELEESAFIDGASYMSILYKIIVPLSVPTIAAISLFAAVGQWNDFYSSMVYITSPKLKVLQEFLQNVLQETEALNRIQNSADYYLKRDMGVRQQTTITPTSIRMTVLIVAIVPIFALYPFVQRFFIKGMTIGAVKG